jgi:hypothetical protein
MAKMRGVVLVEQGDGKHPGKMQYREDLDVPVPTGKWSASARRRPGVCGLMCRNVQKHPSTRDACSATRVESSTRSARGDDAKAGQRVVVDPVQSDPIVVARHGKRRPLVGHGDLTEGSGVLPPHERRHVSHSADMSFQQAAGLSPSRAASTRSTRTSFRTRSCFGGPDRNPCEMAKVKARGPWS